MYKNHFHRIAIMGSGTMGAQIAAHCANLNIPVTLFDMNQDLLDKSIKNLFALKPPPLALKSIANRIERKTFDQLDALENCDLIIEAIVENLEIKKSFFKKIAPYIKPNAVVASNTSGLSINTMVKQIPEALRHQFCGVHFFNPPRFMSLVELIAAENTDNSVLMRLEYFLTATLGKEVVYAKDAPGFIANRLGVFSMVASFYHADQLGIAPDTVDALTGKLIGKPSSATYRTADVVGLDVLQNVVNHIRQNCPDDAWNRFLKLPDWIEALIAKGHLGQKSKQGIYHKRSNGIYVYDLKYQDYRPQKKDIDKQVQKILQEQKLPTALLALSKMDTVQAQFLWRVHRDTMHYAAFHLIGIAHSVRDIDRAICAGFGWTKGIFEIWQEAGWQKITQSIAADISSGHTMVDVPLPKWVNNRDGVYDHSGAFAPSEAKQIGFSKHQVYQRQLFPPRRFGETPINANILMKTDDISLIDLGDGVAAVSFLTKMGSIGLGVLKDMHKALDLLEQDDFHSLVLWNPSAETFCAGANLFEVLVACKVGRYYDNGGLISKVKLKALEAFVKKRPPIDEVPPIVEVVDLGQRLVMRLKHGPIYTIAAVSGLALGGGCELILHSNHAVATMNSYIGLVEVGVGILPAFGGCKEMILRADQQSEGENLFNRAAKHFEQIARATVSSSALEAKKMHYLKEDATIIAHANELLYVAKKEALNKMEQANYLIPQDSTLINVIGRDGEANFLAQLENFHVGHFISDHDREVIKRIAYLFGGGVDTPEAVSAQWLIELEKKLFMELVQTTKTQERMEYILKTGKPLKN